MDKTLKGILDRDYQAGNTPSVGIHAASDQRLTEDAAIRKQLESHGKIIELRDGQRFGLARTQG